MTIAQAFAAATPAMHAHAALVTIAVVGGILALAAIWRAATRALDVRSTLDWDY